MNGRILHTNLICLPLKNIDVVFGMDLHSANSMYIVCKEKVIFIPTNETIPSDAITTLLEGMVNMTNLLF